MKEGGWIMSGLSQWARSHKLQVAAIAAAIVVAIVVAIAVASGAFATSEQQPEQQESRTVDVTLNVTADNGWDENSTPAIAHIEGNDVDFYHAVTPDAEGNKGTSTVALAEGDYTVSFVSPVNSDGSAFDIYDTGAPVDITVDADAKTAPAVDCPMAQIPANQVTDEMLAGIIDQTKDAVKNGDATLKGDSGKAILGKLDGNVSANPNVSDETKEDASKADEGVDIDGKPVDTIGKPADKPSGGNANASGSNTGNSNSGNAGGSDKPSTPAHQHSWTQHTAQRWVSNMVTVPDYETQTVYGARFYVPSGTPGQYIAKGPEYWFENGFTRDDLNAIIVNALRNADENGLYNGVDYSSYQNIEKTVQVQVGSHQEDHGYYEDYVDYVYCSSCGARQ